MLVAVTGDSTQGAPPHWCQPAAAMHECRLSGARSSDFSRETGNPKFYGNILIFKTADKSKQISTVQFWPKGI